AAFQRGTARLALRALRGSTSRLEGTIERRIETVRLSLARRGLSLRLGSRTLILPSVDAGEAKRFVEAAARMQSANPA
ncbi:MAG: hypothetical protein NTX23_05985, partial [Candidatus Bipolaricaulota bacterium]|nr:hypothetical protein [Candidatus Bipolaricaulota bacterium]